ncbi:DUF4295 domain-containing protein [Blattabacterium cuenoti]|uniref:DUF4295 domain-containing protein n=1 Tax=Blattabacterium cuenoti TaxID=1653831 RepID=UPI00163C1F6E|nr:DUF4295 domain-containing protein [Blattabacterium cuenoti]
MSKKIENKKKIINNNKNKMVLAIKMVKSNKKSGVYAFEKKFLKEKETKKFFSN